MNAQRPPDAQLHLLPPRQQLRYYSLRSDKRRQEYLYSRLLICTALSRHYQRPSTSWKIEEPENSPPIIHNLPTPGHISLSHSHELMCFTLNPLRIGVDIEKTRPRKNVKLMAELFMNNRELQQLPETDIEQHQYFYRLWCAKEALYKALPLVKQSTTALTSLSYLQLKNGQFKWQLSEFKLEDYQVAIVYENQLRTVVTTTHFVDTENL
ncbi:phosphopantetheine--protein transferase-like protein [Marinobacterium halophilum]|uniref:Phosphopantetheine--protein transferase-like protein n=1 Tax=Marinobacterium halophilum TaxID=267374 RepID=A0A2P8F4I7_9GAMM|nr:4'-phosphopantetheinyl transferase superfamily protein [Marinobacterium halophilum]PSL16631.1 phosphopantetheine--protein transferase-like protein [Marinobacterium halophilum]